MKNFTRKSTNINLIIWLGLTLLAASGFAGSVTVHLVGGGSFNLVANPFNIPPNNLTTLFPAAQDGHQVVTWDCTTQDYSPVQPTYSSASHTWDHNITIAPGQGFWYVNNGNDINVTWTGT